MKVRLLKEIDFMGVIRRPGDEVEAEPYEGTFAVQMGFGSYLYLTNEQAEPVREKQTITPEDVGEMPKELL